MMTVTVDLLPGGASFLSLLTGRRRRLAQKILSRCRAVDSGDRKLGECWAYVGSHSGSGRGGGYGRVLFEGGWFATHRAIWEVVNGPLPSKKQLDHRCRNRACCREPHNEPVTNRQNQRRKIKT